MEKELIKAIAENQMKQAELLMEIYDMVKDIKNQLDQ